MQHRRHLPVLGPNTNAPQEVLSESVVLCCGEDEQELLAAVAAWGGATPLQTHRYRSYGFWRFRDFTAVLTGMGTRCIEPLLWEVLRVRAVRRVALIGTAGRFAGSEVVAPSAYVVRDAILAGTALDQMVRSSSFAPRWSLPDGCPTASSVSTDFFYGFSPRVMTGIYPLKGRRLKTLFARHSKACDLVDMEVAQFYCFCNAFRRRPDLAYVAVKAPVNTVGSAHGQLERTGSAMTNCITLVRELLRMQIDRQ
jgi:hypothetical protein